jgi:hypothetical protein
MRSATKGVGGARDAEAVGDYLSADDAGQLTLGDEARVIADSAICDTALTTACAYRAT